MIASKELLEQLPTIAQDPNAFEVLFSAQQFRNRLLSEIKQATQRIYLVALYLEDDDAGRQILTELYEAKQRNPKLDITVCVDWHRAQRGLIGADQSEGNAALYKKFAQKYQHPISILGVPVRGKEVFGVLHLKGFIIDNTVIYSGASLNNIYLQHNEKYRFDRYHVMENPALADCMVQYIQQNISNNSAVNCLSQVDRPTTKTLKPAIKQFRALLAQSQYEFTPEIIKQGQVGITPLVGVGKRRNKLNLHINNLIACAEKEITILTPYFNFPKSISKEVKRAIRRGVKVTIIVGDKTANDFYIPPEEDFKTIAGLPYLYELNLRHFARINEGHIASRQLSIHLWKHDNNSFHLKGMWIDKEYMLITGNNFNPRAWKLDLENGLLIKDTEQLLTKQFENELSSILEHTNLIGSYRQLDTLENYPEDVQKLIRKIKRVKADRILKQIL
ncbi:CDP-diacylglycerol--serine O-phosphatidyltransferase [Vibrio algivorus]|uniref:CDP-diacylglycerol--serine O-phosphatidyltransferase n=1 Tax=Vibrio algivorus TaxID=1667024 RepID=A0A557NTA5_9VIBR|nr:CDP-diacylglycerol--serine O-phosphatidyltransferase [Vibrio algivorus]TVO31659.1 CDP-diacylglycerol--serine O-phosphatidyltransferase [Vibrio algivorus]GLT16124.1 CDP-diacylglycerol--serine O-phosphatidyltransferase [Vibrio algivorus]